MTQEITKVRKHFYGDPEYFNQWIVDIVENDSATTGYGQPDGTAGKVYGYDLKAEAKVAAALYVAKNEAKDLGVETSAGEIRKFETGATRDTTKGKLDYRKALSPIVLQRYVQYLNAHRKQPDGSMRDFDNWKQGIPIEAYFEGLGRHDMAAWLLHDGFPAEDNHGQVTLEDTLCAIIFNSIGWLHEILKKKLKENNHLAG